MDLLVKDYIGDTNWDQRDKVEAFLKKFVAAIDSSIEVEVSGEEQFEKDLWTLHLSKGDKRTSIKISLEELVNCNSSRGATKSQKELEQEICRALGEIEKKYRKLGFI